jgi:hypothetical protein
MKIETWGIRLFWGGVLLLIPAFFLHRGLQKIYPALRDDWFVAPSILCIAIGGWMYFIGKVRNAWRFLTDKRWK